MAVAVAVAVVVVVAVAVAVAVVVVTSDDEHHDLAWRWRRYRQDSSRHIRSVSVGVTPSSELTPRARTPRPVRSLLVYSSISSLCVFRCVLC